MHSLRHTFITYANTSNENNSLVVSMMAGHQQRVDETVYTHENIEAMAQIQTPSKLFIDDAKPKHVIEVDDKDYQEYLWDCVAFDEVAGSNFKDKDGIQIMKDYMASGSFARGKEEKAASASMVFVGNINQSVDVLLKTSSLFDPFRRKWGRIQLF